ncbi:23 kDa integral membrane protein-like [Biomphalaria glabrata]|uniref:Tetraspanin n=1 Tax=Biomphalaria glabrata TaxID=6526 RepID=A0A9W2YV81_BIOGL|nr:23 kDa integral membrane protein-like [Biomphalaria glabrata]XP_055866629.1 23 kDa integral membrane protein-like [Biomphalaria glabrata]XP_055866631.1 23 kDa integral membrane protein-like [Biomphalaria glabrata]XP_055866632.1 23 kDa integral membrane protein-like [Biomphalaria glabrata]
MACSTCAKCIFMLLNVLFLVIGLAFLVVGVLLAFLPGTILSSVYDQVKAAVSSTTSYNIPTSADDLKNLPLLFEIGLALFILGTILFVISFLGCCGSCCKCCRFMLILFAIVMLCLMIAQLVVVTMFYVADSPLHKTIRSVLKDKITNEYDEQGEDTFSTSLNLVQHYFECCGIDGAEDFGGKDHSYVCKSNTYGCYSKLTDVIQSNIIWAGLALAGLLALELIEVILAIVIFKSSNKVSPF